MQAYGCWGPGGSRPGCLYLAPGGPDPRWGPSWLSHKLFLLFPVGQNDVEATKAAALHSSATNSTKADASAAPAAASASLEDAELKKLLEKCKRQQAEMDKLVEENRQLKVRREASGKRWLSTPLLGGLSPSPPFLLRVSFRMKA